MKKLIIISITWMLCMAGIKAQITLDTIVYPVDAAYLFRPVQISPSETKYFFADTATNTFGLFNMDFTPFMTNIAVPEPFAFTTDAFQPLYITRTLFDCDSSNIEYAYYSPGNINKPFRIVRTDGTILFAIDSANGPYCSGNCLGLTDIIRPIRNTSDGAKLFLQKSSPTPTQIHIYSLCGTLPMDVFDFAIFNESFVRMSPNPSSGLLTFQINLPDNMNEYELLIFDNGAREMKREKINSYNNNYSIDMHDFNSGNYYYVLSTKDKTYQSGKFILTK